MKVTVLAILGLFVNFIQSFEGLKNDLIHRSQNLRSEILQKSDHSCQQWVLLFRLSQGRQIPDECLDDFRRELLNIDEHSILSVAWVIRYSNQINSNLALDLVAILTTIPFWLSHGGRFQFRSVQGHVKTLDHLTEDNQITWLVSSYIIGETFERDGNKSDIVFEGIDHTGFILSMESKQQLWRWLDMRQQIGFSKLSSKSVCALMTLATLSADTDEQLHRMATMMLYLQLYELQTVLWKDEFLSPKVQENDHPRLYNFLNFMKGDNIQEENQELLIIFLVCQELGFQLPDFLLLGPPEVNPGLVTQTFGLPKSSSIGKELNEPKNCLDWISLNGLHSSLDCFVLLGNAYKLWNRHPYWRYGPFGSRVKMIGQGDRRRLQNIFESFDNENGLQHVELFKEEAFSLMTIESSVTGGQLKFADSMLNYHWKLLFSSKESITTQQLAGHGAAHLIPQIQQFKSTVFAMNNPGMISSLLFYTGETTAHLNVTFDKVFTGHNHWLIGSKNGTFIALYSFKPVRWDEITETHSPVYQIRTLGSQNIWICHAEKVKETTFSNFITKILNSRLEVQQNFRDDFQECLNKHHCLDEGVFNLLKCLRDKCKLGRYLEKSKLARCIIDDPKKKSSVNLSNDLVKLSNCLSKPLMGMKLKWQLEQFVFHFEWGKQLKVWQDNKEVVTRNENALLSSMKNTVTRGQKVINLRSADGKAGLQLDFNQIQYKEL